MGVELIKLGVVCRALAGREAGKLFIVVGFHEDDFILLADGTARTVERPKKKRKKHVECLPVLDEALHEKLQCGKKVYDFELARTLKLLAMASADKGKEV